jgi:hypothetical protein
MRNLLPGRGAASSSGIERPATADGDGIHSPINHPPTFVQPGAFERAQDKYRAQLTRAGYLSRYCQAMELRGRI